ncbi:MAG TPA: hypothetical protein VHH14_06810 [Solirubrobacterales bacterium]|nr:hypothetical protein [Solirubrobacterales bacterium]
MGPYEAFALIAIVLGTAKILGPFANAFADRLRGAPADRDPDPRLADEVEQLRLRLAEVEERLDFAERLLARGGEADQIRGGAPR